MSWWYGLPGSSPVGPFATREEAVTAGYRARRGVRAVRPQPPQLPFVVGQTKPLLPAHWVDDNLEQMLETMEVGIDDYTCRSDDTVFFVPKERQDEAQKALQSILKAWAEQYVQTTVGWMVDHDTAEDIP